MSAKIIIKYRDDWAPYQGSIPRKDECIEILEGPMRGKYVVCFITRKVSGIISTLVEETIEVLVDKI